MTTVTVREDNDSFSIEIKGHAGFSTYGKDIVCASISTLTIYNLNLINELGYKDNISNLVYKDGYVKFGVLVNDSTLKKIVNLFLSSILDISKTYPKNLKLVRS